MFFVVKYYLLLFLPFLFFIVGCHSAPSDISGKLLEIWAEEIVPGAKNISDRMITTHDEDGVAAYYWKTDEYLKSPVKENLEPVGFSRLLYLCNAEQHIFLAGVLKKHSFLLCSEAETARLFKMLYNCDHTDLPLVHIWMLEKDLYLLVCHHGGSSGERSYLFFATKNNKVVQIADFQYLPELDQIREVADRIRSLKNK